MPVVSYVFFFSSRRRHTRLQGDWSSDVCSSDLGKGIFGAVVVGGFFAIGGMLVHAFFRRNNPKDYKRMSLLQYSIMMTFLLTMFGLPIKMLLRLLFHIKYVWITPWFNV